MKKYKLSLMTIVTILATTYFTSCNDDAFLEEFSATSYTLASAFNTTSQINDCLTEIYRARKSNMMNPENSNSFCFGTDILDHRNEVGDVAQWSILANWNTNSRLQQFNNFYNMVSMCNQVLYGAEQVTWPDESDKTRIVAEAHFLRGYFYLNIAELWGGVPIVEEFSESPRTDYVRTSRKETYEFVVSELSAAAAALPEHQTPGRVGKGAAYHYLAETYLALAADQSDQSYLDKAISAADEVMKRHSLMKDRFGVRADPASTGSYQGVPNYFPDGDVYFDLFQRGNLDYEEGNTESLWVDQNYLPADGQYSSSIPWPRNWGPQGSHIRWKTEYAEEGAGAGPFLGSAIPNDQFNLPANTCEITGGRSIGAARPSNFVNYGVWKDCGDDIRNSPVNIRRSFPVRDPKHSMYGQMISMEEFPIYCEAPGLIDFHPVFTKACPIDNWGYEGVEAGYSNRSNIYHDFYIARAAETLLLRAEAKLKKGDKAGAAADINEVRGRAHAPLITPDEVTIDYILDERVRELYVEENRWQTLLRMGGDIARNRIMKYAINFADYPEKKNGEPWTDFLWPIPQTTIDSNINAVLEQNPGWN